MSNEFVTLAGSTVPRLIGWRSRPRLERGGCALCRWDGAYPRPASLVEIGTSDAYWSTVFRCEACGGYRMVWDRGSTRLTAEEAERALVAKTGDVAVPEPWPPVVQVVAERADRGPDGRWQLPPRAEGLDVGTRANDIWYLETLALIGDVVVGDHPGARGRVHTASWVERPYAQDGRRLTARGWRIDVPSAPDAGRVSEQIDLGSGFSHDRWAETGHRWLGLVGAIGPLAGYVPVRGGHEVVWSGADQAWT